ncbi:hypothetical protein F1643_10735 [Azospirillum sp. INR13]|uniref:hypothetical protein n=1 Tax=Azospirillum sp. INR13 TaxID=2596919 RepID=UPI001891FDA8|nr:hypothetical protein [Azospirillum sp. INR13]MBF5094890.1 hypothetical protein [Azospirillum sp. INR13]
MLHEKIEKCVRERTLEVLKRAEEYSNTVADKASAFVNDYVTDKMGGTEDICFAATGSVGRREALEASDLDLLPIARNDAALEKWRPHDKDLRAALAGALKIKVSKGDDLTAPCSLPGLTSPQKIGGDEDCSAELTKRVLLITESVSVGGGMPIADVRTALLDAYGNEDRTSGRHILSLCNDVARYYKTLCVEYIPRVMDPEKDWGTRNIKLRHSRKFWYFSTIMSMVTIADDHPKGDAAFKQALLEAFAKSPANRLADAIIGTHRLGLGRLLEAYGNFLEFMSCEDNRRALAEVKHETRYTMTPGNPFLPMKLNSDLMHAEIMSIFEELGGSARSRIVGWFML